MKELQFFKRTKWFSQEDADEIIANKGRMPAVFVVVSFGDGIRYFDEYGMLNDRLLSEDDDDSDLERRVNEVVSDCYCGYDFEYKKVET